MKGDGHDCHAGEIAAITERIRERSRPAREVYLGRLDDAAGNGANRAALSCGNLAHGFAVCSPSDKAALGGDRVPNLGIITSYNDMLSAHQPFETFPALIKEAAREAGGIAQVAGGVPAMCDGVTQGQPGMELSLFSRDVIAMSAAIGLSHNMFDAAVYLGVCDKIVPGLVIAALTFGHLPAVFIPAGPMTTGLPNDEKAKVRQLYAEGKVGRAELLEAEAKSYHGPGTCTFYGTANSNQMLMEIMGLHTPGASFVNPEHAAARRADPGGGEARAGDHRLGNDYTPVGRMIDERSIVNGVVGLHATGGSTNHTIHLIAMAAAAGIAITWQDISDLSDAVPLLARVYPNGLADVNHFHAAGGMGFLIRELLDAGLLHEDVQTVWGAGPAALRGRGEARRGRQRRARAGAGKERRREGAGAVRQGVPAERRPEGAVRQSRQGDHQDLGGEAGAPRHRGAGARVRQPAGAERRLQGGRARPRFRRRRALPGAEGQRHAGTAQADHGARRAAGPRPARWRWSPTGACRAPRARCRRRST